RAAAPELVRPRLPRDGPGARRDPDLSRACRRGDAGLVPDRPARGPAAPAARRAGPAPLPGGHAARARPGRAAGRPDRDAAGSAHELRLLGAGGHRPAGAGRLAAAAQAQYHELVELPAIRGAIYDRNLRQLVVNTTVYSAFVSPDQVPDDQRARVALALGSVLGADANKVNQTLASGAKFAYIA